MFMPISMITYYCVIATRYTAKKNKINCTVISNDKPQISTFISYITRFAVLDIQRYFTTKKKHEN